MTTSRKKFKFHLVRDKKLSEDGKVIQAYAEKDVVIEAPSACEAQVIASKQSQDFTVISCEALPYEMTELEKAERAKFERELAEAKARLAGIAKRDAKKKADVT